MIHERPLEKAFPFHPSVPPPPPRIRTKKKPFPPPLASRFFHAFLSLHSPKTPNRRRSSRRTREAHLVRRFVLPPPPPFPGLIVPGGARNFDYSRKHIRGENIIPTRRIYRSVIAARARALYLSLEGTRLSRETLRPSPPPYRGEVGMTAIYPGCSHIREISFVECAGFLTGYRAIIGTCRVVVARVS